MLVALEAMAGDDFWGSASFANGTQILGRCAWSFLARLREEQRL